MNKIQQEEALSQDYMLSLIPDSRKQLVKLSQDNVARIEAMISNDSGYLKGRDKNNKPSKKSNGSTAFWMCELKKVLLGDDSSEYQYRTIVAEAVCAVDRENTTHLNADGVGREQITDRICNIPQDKLIEYLKFPDETNLELIEIIAQKTMPIENGKKSRCNPSFASKFCHYAAFYLFENTEYQDNFSIYDNVLKNVIPLYAKYYGIEYENLDDYRNYRNVVDGIITKSGGHISRNGFDHLLWYYHKGRL